MREQTSSPMPCSWRVKPEAQGVLRKFYHYLQGLEMRNRSVRISPAISATKDYINQFPECSKLKIVLSDWIRYWIIEYLKSSFERKIYPVFEMYLQ